MSSTATSPSTSSSPGLFLPVMTLARREMVRFFRQRNRVVSALLQPLIFWVFFGAAFRGSFQPPAGMSGAEGSTPMTYQEYFFPGTIIMILLFTAIFSTISIIEDRREGFLQSVLVAPISRLAMGLFLPNAQTNERRSVAERLGAQAAAIIIRKIRDTCSITLKEAFANWLRSVKARVTVLPFG